MSAVLVILRGLARGSDDLTGIVTRHGDLIEQAIRNGDPEAFLRNAEGLDAASRATLMRSPVFTSALRKMADNVQYIDDLGRAGADVDTGALLRRLEIDAASPAGRAITQSADEIRQIGSRIDDTLGRSGDTIADARARLAAGRAAPAAADGLSFMDRMMLNRLKIGLGLSVAGAGAVIAEWKTQALSRGAANLTMDIARGLENIDPELARQVREGGLDALIFGADIADTPRTAAINYAAEVLTQNGQPEAAAAIRIGGVVMNPVTYADLALTPEGQRGEAFISRLETAGVTREEITNYLATRPTQLAMIQENLGHIDLSRSLPGLRQTARAIADNAEVVRNLQGEGLTARFNEVVQSNNLNMFSSVSMFFATVLSWIGPMLGMNDMADHFKRSVIANATVSQFGDQFGMSPASRLAPAAPGAPQIREPAPAPG